MTYKFQPERTVEVTWLTEHHVTVHHPEDGFCQVLFAQDVTYDEMHCLEYDDFQDLAATYPDELVTQSKLTSWFRGTYECAPFVENVEALVEELADEAELAAQAKFDREVAAFGFSC